VFTAVFEIQKLVFVNRLLLASPFTLYRSAIRVHGYSLWISLYFLSFFIFAVIIMCNLLIALIVVRELRALFFLHQQIAKSEL
jgi:hypothetical protein